MKRECVDGVWYRQEYEHSPDCRCSKSDNCWVVPEIAYRYFDTAMRSRPKISPQTVIKFMCNDPNCTAIMFVSSKIFKNIPNVIE